MKLGYKKLLTVELVMMCILILNTFFFKLFNQISLFLFLVVVLIAIIALLGFEKDKYLYKKEIMLNIFIYVFSYKVIAYLLGLYVGFIKSGYSLKILSIFKNVFPVVLIIIISELIRYEFLSKGKEKKLFIALSFVIFVLLDITLLLKNYDITSISSIIKMLGVLILPSITKNLLLTSFCMKSGYKITIFYRSLTELLVFIIPIIPNLGIYIDSTISVILPIYILLITFSNFNINNERAIIDNQKRRLFFLIKIIINIVTIITMILTSGLFKYYVLTIGSNSMKPKLTVGDVVLVKKLNQSELKNLKVKDILIHKNSNRVVVHQIVSIKNIDNKYIFRTKGDNNKKMDNYLIKEEEVIGKSVITIPYLGYPVIIINKIIDRR